MRSQIRQTRKCPPGKILRRSYTRKNTGTRVKAACIRSQSPYNTKAKNTKTRQANRLARLMGTKKRCPPGQIARSAYVRKISANVARQGYLKRTSTGKTVKVFPKSKSVFVPASCVKDLGKAGKLQKGQVAIGPLRKGELSKHGYSYKLSETERRAALQKAISEYGALSTYRKLNAVAKLTTRANPTASTAFATDRNWIDRTYGVQGHLKAF